MRPYYYVVNPGGTVEPANDLLSWGVWYEQARELPFEDGGRKVARSDLLGDLWVSTVFLGLDHGFGNGPPVLFETMIFSGSNGQQQWRYGTVEEARAGHAHAVRVACGEVEDDR